MPEQTSRARVLLIDDEDATRYIFRRILIRAGFDVEEAATGSEGLAKGSLVPDIIIADVNLPDMLGYEVCRRLKANPLTAAIPVIQVSAAFVSDESKVQGLQGGADAYLTQPIEPAVLVAQVNALLRLSRAENISRISGLQWEITFNALSDGLALADDNGILLRANSTFMKLLNLVYSEIESLPLATIFASRFTPALADLLGPGEDARVFELSSGSRWFRVRYHRIESDPIKPAGSVLIITDITEYKKLQETLKSRERLAATGRLAHIMAHEINNPLEAMSNLLYLAAGDHGTAQERLSYIEQASSELERISTITKQVLSYHRESLFPALAPAGEIMDAAITMFRVQTVASGIEIISRVDCQHAILVRAGELRQVFSNLISNAIDAMSSGRGILRVRCTASRNYTTQVLGVRFLFSDTGHGIPQQSLPHIFEPFYTTKTSKGSGIGLWLSEEVVKKHGGVIRLRTRTQGQYRGTLFDIFLPIATESDHQRAGSDEQ